MSIEPAISLVYRSELTATQLTDLAGEIAQWNQLPQWHIGYLGEQPGDIAAELRELDGDPIFAIAREGRTERGLLGVEWDRDLPRTWLHGPWAATPELMDRLYQQVLPHIPPGARPHELFCDQENTAVVAFADRHGFAPHGQQVIMRFRREQLADLASVRLPRLSQPFHEQFAQLHDRSFPGTYAPARSILADLPPVLVATDRETLLGYLVLKWRPEQSEALVEFLAVTEAARGQGIGTRLVTAALFETFADPRFDELDLITDNVAARRLYERVGFTLLRHMRSFRCTAARPQPSLPPNSAAQ